MIHTVYKVHVYVCGLEAHAAMVMEQDDCLSLVLFISKR